MDFRVFLFLFALVHHSISTLALAFCCFVIGINVVNVNMCTWANCVLRAAFEAQWASERTGEQRARYLYVPYFQYTSYDCTYPADWHLSYIHQYTCVK